MRREALGPVRVLGPLGRRQLSLQSIDSAAQVVDLRDDAGFGLQQKEGDTRSKKVSSDFRHRQFSSKTTKTSRGLRGSDKLGRALHNRLLDKDKEGNKSPAAFREGDFQEAMALSRTEEGVSASASVAARASPPAPAMQRPPLRLHPAAGPRPLPQNSAADKPRQR